MSEEELEKLIKNNFYEDFGSSAIYIKTKDGINKRLGINTFVYLCKKCYQAGYEKGILEIQQKNKTIKTN